MQFVAGRMIRLYTLAIYALLLTATLTAAIKSSLEEHELLVQARGRAGTLIAGTEDSISLNLRRGRTTRISKIMERLKNQDGIQGISICTKPLESSTISPATRPLALGFPKGQGWEIACKDAARLGVLDRKESKSWNSRIGSRDIEFDAHWVENESGDSSFELILAQDFSYAQSLWMSSFLRTFLLTLVGGTALLLLTGKLVRRWFGSNLHLLHEKLHALARGRILPFSSLPAGNIPHELRPLSLDIERLSQKILMMPQMQLKTAQESWLQSLRETMGGRKLVVIANREPYIHNRNAKEGKVEVVRPASGLVTALEPVLRQSGGLWLAHGSGTADRENVDENSEVQVPPGNPRYTLKRVWLTPEEESGYYYGFSNEGLWPLCHLAHNRPIFRLTDWEKYGVVNQRFCDATPKESLTDKSLILVQDYHFALLPRMLKKRAATLQTSTARQPKVATFWHIPWPNPEAFGICPWSKELLNGILGSDVIGFHTQYHCNNFLETCDRYLEARIDWESFSVTMENHETLIRAFPIGIDTAPVHNLSDSERNELKTKYGITAEIVAVGVDRLDYTKGLLERVGSVERFLEKYPQYVGKFTLIQMGSPSRSNIPAYQMLSEQLAKEVKRVNDRFGNESGYRPIIFLSTHHEWDEIQLFYQLGDICMVTSLHDGMNLVAKEYIWCQRPDRGSLILSKFAGASRELTDAFIVNPYSIEEMADSIAAAIVLPKAERTRRMQNMREKVESHNAFHWAAEIIQTLVTKVSTQEPVKPLTHQLPTEGRNSNRLKYGIHL